ncbi:glycosyltransferase family 2 protein [Gilvibacter sp.]|uniref:glycosyltransferase family 2 protein n=1 Tax=Gilvibacter sp. TaxID=2729997 RepID=UPI003B5181E7
MKPDVTIVIPSFNSEKFLLETLQSVARQSWEQLECLVIDDGSNDNTPKIAKDFAENDRRFQFFERDPNQPKGANACRNQGLFTAQGDYVIFLDADDILLPKAVENRLSTFKSHPDLDALVYSYSAYSDQGAEDEILNYDPDQESEIEYLKAFLSYQIPWQTSCPIWKRETLLKFGGFDLNFTRFQDVELHTRMLLSGIQIARIHKADFFYRQVDQGSKYKDKAFLGRAMSGIEAFLDKFAADRFPVDVIDLQERRALLRQSLRKCLDKFGIPNQMWAHAKSLISTAKKSGIINSKQAWAFRVYLFMVRSQWYKTKGLGMYKIFSWSKRISELKAMPSP